jgi:hypothetical protein
VNSVIGRVKSPAVVAVAALLQALGQAPTIYPEGDEVAVLVDLTDRHIQRHPEPSGPVARFDIKQRFIIAQFQYDETSVAALAPERTAGFFAEDHARLEIMLVTKAGDLQAGGCLLRVVM